MSSLIVRLIVVLFCISCTFAATHGIHEMNLNWSKLNPSSPDEPVRLYVAFKNRNVDWLYNTLMEVSNPLSDNYGKHPSADQVRTKTSPRASDVQHVISWLQSANIVPSSTAVKDLWKTGYLVVTTNVRNAEQLLRCKFFDYVNVENQKVVSRAADGYSLPPPIASIVSFVGGVDHFPVQEKKGHQRGGPPVLPQNIVNPASIRMRYNVTVTAGTAPNNLHAVAEYDGQYYDETDLSKFFVRNNLPNTTVSRVIGRNNGTTGYDGGEADLDIQYLMGVGVAIPTWFIILDRTIGDGFLEWVILLNLLGNEGPYLHSTSYGDDERNLSPEYLDRVSEDLMKLGSIGRSLFFSAGDYGVGCNCSQSNNAPYVAHFPASSPFVTSIGATISLPTLNGPEVGISWSGGGFSNHFTRQSYQQQAVNNFLTTSPVLPPSQYFNASNRGYPDMSAWGLNYEIYEHGNLDYIGGTSASTPNVAGMFSLINDNLLQRNMPPLGFVNPAIYLFQQQYQSSEATRPFYDVIKGNNGVSPCCVGFTCQTNWDPLSGLGTPNFVQLLNLFLSNSQ